MIGTLMRAAALVVTAWTIAFFAERAQATVFAAWEVSGVAWNDTLNVRAYPASTSRKQASYPNGTVLQMTGRCTGNGPNLLDIASQPAAEQQDAVRGRWCEIWHDPARDGAFVAGWVYGRYIAPH